VFNLKDLGGLIQYLQCVIVRLLTASGLSILLLRECNHSVVSRIARFRLLEPEGIGVGVKNRSFCCVVEGPSEVRSLSSSELRNRD
jgi:hypothetical protein